ncbi:unnamed protein product [Heligmosomoides polygyrus]|uniref:DUF1758 domain-containing protein n=1 Tax=Heligmosomoides polygyrus TaxID=6339 RepID=A0A183FQS2_HELPZ|nr:unnamed protein product [Heligmosomoides polygyrus]
MTKRINVISEWIGNTTPLLDFPPEEDQRRRVHKYRMILSTCEDHIERLESSLNALANAHDNVEASAKDEVEFSKYIDNALDVVMALHNHRERLSCTCSANSARTESQRQLFEQLSAIVTQLKDHGEHIDNYLTVNTVLQKFHTRIQKAAMDKSIRNDNCSARWTLGAWLDTIDEIISQEEKCKEMMSVYLTQEVFPRKPANTRTPSKRIQNGCEYCAQQGHRWNSCQDIPTPSAKRTFLIDTHRCLNCGSSTHQVAACSSGNCRRCNGRHHTATCTRTSEQLLNKEMRETPDPRRATTPQQPRNAKQTPTERKPTRSSKQLAVATETKETEPSTEGLQQDTVVLQTHKQDPIKTATRNKEVLLAGTAQVLDSQNRMHDTVVLLDTGSELSFISNELADNLAMPTVESTTLSISTFSLQLPAVKQCDITELKMNDIEGRQYNLRLHKTEHITDAIEQADLGPDDLAFIAQHTITLSLPKKTSKLQPQILLGCDYLWNFILPIVKLILPSGLQLIPTKFGYIISGCQAQRSEPHTMFVFTDASKIAMAACVYIGSPSSTNLIIAKSKLPTLKAVTTIPKLEMNALTLGARLAHFSYSSLRASSNVHQILFFSDSEIALGWIKAPPDRKAAGVLVTNRLEEIRRIVEDLHAQGVQCLFGHIPTAENPADLGTRGSDIASSELWWKGPQLIQGDIIRTLEYQRMSPIHPRESSEDEDTTLHTMVASLA